MRHNFYTSLLVLALSNAAFCATPVSHQLPDAKVVGSGTLSMAFWEVYHATLYAGDGEFSFDRPFALSIQYKREINGADIADRSVQEMRKQGFTNEGTLATWNTKLKAIFPNVKNGTVLTAVFVPGKETRFYEADKPIGVMKGAEFTRYFADIWLSEKTSEPDLRRKLLGMS